MSPSTGAPAHCAAAPVLESRQLRFGAERRRLRVGVTELLAGPFPPPFGLTVPGGRERLWLGQALHRRYQREAECGDPGFRGEVALELGLEQDGWEVTLHGRADGVRECEDGGLLVEELKTLRSGAAPAAARRAAGAQQVAIYAWMLAARSGRAVRAELVWLAAQGDTTPRREPVPVDPPGVAAFVRKTLAARLRQAEAERRERAAHRRGAARLRLPHAGWRPGQERIAEAVSQALAQREHLLVSAPTGLGKTAAVLLPALRHALAEGLRVVLLTARGTQQRGALALHAALGGGCDAPALQLRSKRALCINDVLLCHEERCRFARQHRRGMAESGVVERLLGSGPVVGPEALRSAAREAVVCPHALALAVARRAPLTVGDYNHALEPAAALDVFSADADPRQVILILDEAHNVVERARAAASARLDAPRLARAAAEAELGGAPVHRELAALLGELAAWLGLQVDDAIGGAATPEAAVDLELPHQSIAAWRERLDAALGRYLEYRLATRSLEPEDPIVEAWRSVARFAQAAERASLDGSGCVAAAERRQGAPALVLLCQDPGPRLAALFERCHSVIGVSATLAPLELHRELLGLDPRRTRELEVPSPFAAQQRRVVIDPGVGTRLPERAREAGPIAARLAALAHAVPGHCLALLPSYAFLDAVAARLPALPGRLLRQRPELSEAEREALLAALCEPAQPPLLVLAVAGGLFAEGVDYPDNALRAVAVVGPCLPPRDLARELLRRHFDERFEAGFEYAYVLPGMTRVVQAAGRLIRSSRDRGVIALYGRRFLEPPYRDALPAEWLDGGLPEDRVGDPAAEARAFFAASDGD